MSSSSSSSSSCITGNTTLSHCSNHHFMLQLAPTAQMADVGMAAGAIVQHQLRATAGQAAASHTKGNAAAAAHLLLGLLLGLCFLLSGSRGCRCKGRGISQVLLHLKQHEYNWL